MRVRRLKAAGLVDQGGSNAVCAANKGCRNGYGGMQQEKKSRPAAATFDGAPRFEKHVDCNCVQSNRGTSETESD